jgi:capsule polysaccharide export protein KpsE/RkpR
VNSTEQISNPKAPTAELAYRARLAQRMRLLWDGRRLLFRTLVFGALASLTIALLIPARYQATGQLMPPDVPTGAGMAMLSAISGRVSPLGGVASDLLGAKNSGALFVGILGSRTVQDRLIEQFDLQRLYHSAKIEDARQSLAAHTAVEEDRKSGIISITVTDHNPRRAAAMAQAYVNELDRLVEQVSTSAARRERLFLEGRLRAVKQDLDAAAQQFSEFASKNTAIDIPVQSKAMVEAAAALQGQLIAAESELRGLEAMYTEQNVRVRALRARVGELRSQLEKLGGDSSGAGSATGKADVSLYPAIRQLPLLGVRYADLYHQTKIQETVYELLTQQYELAKVEEAKEVPSVKVLDAPTVPTKKSFPPRPLFTAAGTMLALLAATAWLFGKQAWRDIDPQDPAKQFALEVAGALRLETARLAPAMGVLRQRLERLYQRSPRKPSLEGVPEEEFRPELRRVASNRVG